MDTHASYHNNFWEQIWNILNILNSNFKANVVFLLNYIKDIGGFVLNIQYMNTTLFGMKTFWKLFNWTSFFHCEIYSLNCGKFSTPRLAQKRVLISNIARENYNSQYVFFNKLYFIALLKFSLSSKRDETLYGLFLNLGNIILITWRILFYSFLSIRWESAS